MSNALFIVVLTIMLLFIALLYCKMILIHWRSERDKVEKVKGNYQEFHELYLETVSRHNKKPISNPSITQMINHINKL